MLSERHSSVIGHSKCGAIVCVLDQLTVQRDGRLSCVILVPNLGDKKIIRAYYNDRAGLKCVMPAINSREPCSIKTLRDSIFAGNHSRQAITAWILSSVHEYTATMNKIAGLFNICSKLMV